MCKNLIIAFFINCILNMLYLRVPYGWLVVDLVPRSFVSQKIIDLYMKHVL